ncbi:MAG: EAL domain-containing protein [Thiovulaceae bacterium]|nr:EAL domain-containing protein [Sulfurimonadaceae bacterium]
MIKKTTYAKITAKIIFVTLFITLLGAYFYGEYMKKEAIQEMAQIDASKTSKLVFEALYSEMKKGWNKDDIHEVISRLNKVDSQMKIDIYRSEVVAKLFGDIEKDKQARETDLEVMQAIHGKKLLNIVDSKMIIYDYPIVAKDECKKCHVNAQVGDILGVIKITYPIENLKVSFEEMINFFIIFILIFSIIIFIGLFLELNLYLIRPIRNFSNTIKNITKSKDLKLRIDVNNHIQEIDSIQETFNNMLSSIEYQFYHDALTGLENRKKLIENLEKKVNSFLVIINIDSFQEINDLYGDISGDIILQELAKFLKESMPKDALIYRLHSDEFAYLCQNNNDFKEFLTFASLLSENISKKIFVIEEQGGEVNLTVTLGISYGDNFLLTNADIALTLAKKSRKHFLVYDESMAMAKEYEKNFEWGKKLKKAIDEDRVIPVYQPIVDIKTQKIIKYEALIRIKDYDGKYIAPIHFLELSKKNKLYHRLTKIMISKTLDKFKELPYLVSINISVEDILNQEIYTFIIEKLKNSAMGDRIIFEIIESEGIENFEEVLTFIDDVKKCGAKISIDDFGTGYSNFDYLMKLKVDYIKIDGSMIKNVDTDKNAQMITQTIVEFAKKLKIHTVAEFVYSKNIFEKVKELDVDFAQGYYFGEPKEL